MTRQLKKWIDNISNQEKLISNLPDYYQYGKLIRATGIIMEVTGLELPIGSTCIIEKYSEKSIIQVECEVVGFKEKNLFVIPLENVDGIFPGAKVYSPELINGKVSTRLLPLGIELLGRVLNSSGQFLDRLPPPKILRKESLYTNPINPLLRDPITKILDVGVRAINGLITVGRGQRMGLFAGSGVGKSMLLGMMARYTEADIIVVALIGERGREVKDFIENILKKDGISRSVVIAAPADISPMLRIQGAVYATRIAEDFRNQGINNIRAEVTAQIDFTKTEQTLEQHKPNTDPKEMTIRSQQITENKNFGNIPEGIPGALSNQPSRPTSAVIEDTEDNDNKSNLEPLSENLSSNSEKSSNIQNEKTINYEIDRTITHNQFSSGTLKKLSVAVVINNRSNSDGSQIKLNEQEMQNVNALVRETMGYSENRGDTVNIVNMNFVDDQEELSHFYFWENPRLQNIMFSIYSRSDLQSVLDAFHNDARTLISPEQECYDYLKTTLSNALGEEQALLLLEEFNVKNYQLCKGIDTLKTMNPETIFHFIKNEHPQIITVTLSLLKRNIAADILSKFDNDLRRDILIKIANLSKLTSTAIKELTLILNDLIQSQKAYANTQGGIKPAAEILNYMQSDQDKTIQLMKEVDQKLTEKIIKKMFIFDDLQSLDDQSLQRILREVENDSLIIALKGCKTELIDKVLNNMSQRQAEILREDLNLSKPIKLSKVETERKKILDVIRTLSDADEITLKQDGESYV
uniref:AAA+ ATPase domain-containing protein n=1 Tax=Glossina austeni TaxID=7395 RepID=A0A1A9UKM5_GLOAU